MGVRKSSNLLIKSQNQNVFQKFKINRNLQRIPFKMIYNMSMLRHRFSKNGGGGGGALNHLPLLFCKRNFAKSVFANIFAKFEFESYSLLNSLSIDV